MGSVLLVIFLSEYVQLGQSAELKAHTWLAAGKHQGVFVSMSISELCVKE